MDASESGRVSTKQQRIAKLAKQSPEMSLTSLAYHMDMEWMREAYRRTRKDGALGVDKVTAAEYEENLEENLGGLLERAKAGSYKAPPVRRAYIPKGDNEYRPIGIPTLEDKVMQKAVVMLLEPIYEQDFLGCSYGFRPERNAHQALESIWKNTMNMAEVWVLDVDIKNYFGTIKHQQLHEILRHRVNDGVIRRLIGKWLKAGVAENGNVSYPEEGTPQGGVISPLLSNIYLHEVLDAWYERDVRPRMTGRTFLLRYADDFILGFANKKDALRVMEVLPKRFDKYGLTIHPEKTRLVRFTRPTTRDGGGEDPGSFDFLGFTHYWGKSRKGNWVVQRKTIGKRLSRKLAEVSDWCRRNRHKPVKEQGKLLELKLKGHYGYYGIIGNTRSLRKYFRGVQYAWYKWLNRRRGNRDRPWSVFEEYISPRFLPEPRIRHSIYSRRA